MSSRWMMAAFALVGVGCSNDGPAIDTGGDDLETFIAGGNGGGGNSNNDGNNNGNSGSTGGNSVGGNGGGNGASNLPGLDELSYQTDIDPMLTQYCGQCHLFNSSSGGLNFDGGVGDLVGVASIDIPSMDLVSAGNPDNSYLLLKMEDAHNAAGGKGGVMPPNSEPQPSGLEIEQVRQWIVAGAQP